MYLSDHSMNLAWEAIDWLFSTDGNTNTNY